MQKPRIKVLGERNSGTNYLSQLVRKNFEASLLVGSFPRIFNHWPMKQESVRDFYFKHTYTYNLGWKHAIAPSESDINRTQHRKLFFLTITKNPYSWLLSMYNRPYHYKGNIKSFEEFLQTPWPVIKRERYDGLFLNPVEVWNVKNSSYLNLLSYANTLPIRYEDILNDPENITHKIGESAELVQRSSEFVNINKASKKQDSGIVFDDYRAYYIEERWREKLTENQITLINGMLDFDVIKDFSYSII